jgi:hypothetical protein
MEGFPYTQTQEIPMDIQEKIERAHYVANDHDVEQLAASHYVTADLTKRIDGAYLRILIAALQAKFPVTNRKRALTVDERQRHGVFITETHGHFYQAVLRGITTPDVTDDTSLTADERRARAGIRSGRAGFARSAASTLQSFIKSGGDTRTLELPTVSKSQLRAFVLAHESPRPRMELIMGSLGRVEAQVATLIEDDPDQARAAVEECMARLQRILDELPAEAQHQAESARLRRKAA